MRIGPAESSLAHPATLRGRRTTSLRAAEPERVDSVDISLESRARLAASADIKRTAETKTNKNCSDRLHDIRARIETGFYESKEALSKIIDGLVNDL